jgi:glucose-1-phosphate thymidylyltransferase
MKGLILAGGHGTRLRPLTFTGNKHMIPIANKPMLFYGLEHLVNAGIKEIAIVLGPIQEGIRESIGDGSKFGVRIDYIAQPVPRGLAHAVQIAEQFIGEEPFIMYLGDNLIKQGIVPLIRTFYNNSSDCVICVAPVKNPSQYGIVELDSAGRAHRLLEKPKETNSNLALAGVYLFNHHIFEAVRSISPSWRNELEITDAIQFLVQSRKKVSVQHINGWWKDTGRPEDLLEANHLVLEDIETRIEAPVDSSCHLMGKIIIKEHSKIKPNSRLKGPVVIGSNCEIGPNVYIGPYSSIGDNSKILSGELEGSIVMENVHIDCNRRIIDSIISRNSFIRSSQHLLPSASKLIIGENSVCNL